MGFKVLETFFVDFFNKSDGCEIFFFSKRPVFKIKKMYLVVRKKSAAPLQYALIEFHQRVFS